MKSSHPNELGDKYPVLLRSLRRRQGFGIAFVECNPAQAKELSRRLPEDLPTKRIETLELTEPIDELYPVVAALPHREAIQILLVVGLEKSVVAYIREGETGYSGVGGYYQRDNVPRIMGHLNMQRERFRDDFDICFVFLLPRFALNYFRHRAADFFDWRSGVYAMQRDEAMLAQESSRLLEDTEWETYRSLTPVQRQERLLEIGDLIDAPLTGERKAQLWREKGRLLAVDDHYEEALASYDKAVEFKPDFHEAWYNLACLCAWQQSLDAAITHLQKAIDLNPKYRDMAKTDTDFDSIRNNDRFLELLDEDADR